MASNCQVLIDKCPVNLASELIEICQNEAQRIEAKFSRYLTDNVVYTINHSHKDTFQLDDETVNLLRFADTCYHLSNKKFDITSGILRRIWIFDQESNLPTRELIENYKQKIGWQKTLLTNNGFYLPRGMEIDFGGIGKEYAVDRCATLLSQQHTISFALNFGGDVYVNQPRSNNRCWKIGIETPGNKQANIRFVELANGGMATSGNTKRYFIKNGKKFGHIMDPTSAMPVENAPLSVTVIAENCTQAGMLATFAMLNGENAESFLKQQGVRFWVYR